MTRKEAKKWIKKYYKKLMRFFFTNCRQKREEQKRLFEDASDMLDAIGQKHNISEDEFFWACDFILSNAKKE